MIIDGHAHLGGEYRDLPSILSTLDRSGADKVILCPGDSPRDRSMWIPHMTGRMGGKNINFPVNWLIRLGTRSDNVQEHIDRQNEEVFNIAALSGERVIQFFWANPLKEGIMEDVREKYGSWRFKGIKLHQGCHPFRIQSEGFHHIAGFASANHIPVFVHLYSKKEIRDFIAVSRSYETIFITGHLIGLDLFIRKRQHVGDNIFFDISCPPLVPKKRIKLALKTFGARKIVMGSDTPFGRDNLRVVISGIRSLGLPVRETGLILGNNMKEILGI